MAGSTTTRSEKFEVPPGNETILVYIKTTFVAYHRYIDAPEEVAFLRNWHRHVFHVMVMVEVTHANRDVEFFTLKRKVEEYIDVWFRDAHFELSCEQIATMILRDFEAKCVEVSEDGENGAVVQAPNTFIPGK